MGRRSSDTEEESRSRRKKKHRRRSSSSSSSDSRSYSRKKSGRKSRSRSRSRDLQSWSHSYEKRRRHRSSSSSSYGSRRKRSRSRGRGKSSRSQRSRSKSRARRSRQRSYSRSSERSGHRRTPSGSRERRKRDKDKAKDKAKGKEKEIYGTKVGDSANIKAGLEHLTPAEQAKARLQLVLEAAAKADEALKAKERSEEEAKRRKEEDQATLLDQVRRVKEIEAIESDAFVPQTFRSSKEVKKSTEPPEVQHEPGNVGAGASEAAAPDKDPPAANIPTAIKYQDDNSLAHPNLFLGKAEAEERWFQRLVALRQERLMGSPVA
ncbi:serine/Arginine-related protein 53 isoform 1-T2 [Acridotheres tristis]